MLMFLATILEQLDLALDHVTKGDIHNARYGLMLTDNAIELFLHRLAQEKSANIQRYRHIRGGFEHEPALNKALGRAFDAKVKYAKLGCKLSEEAARTINILHGYRNEVYHVGLQHETILPTLAQFYLSVVCDYLRDQEPGYFGWSSGMALPERARKYFKGDRFMPGRREEFGAGCVSIADAIGYNPATTVSTLANHMDDVIETQDSCIDIIAQGVYEGQQTTRDKAIVGCQTWPLAFSEEGEAFATKHGYKGSKFDLVEWLGANYPLKYPRDPIPSWQRRAAALRQQESPHIALDQYHAFMGETAALRDAIYESASQAEAEIDATVDRMRGK